jgi:hypothetical protein
MIRIFNRLISCQDYFANTVTSLIYFIDRVSGINFLNSAIIMVNEKQSLREAGGFAAQAYRQVS